MFLISRTGWPQKRNIYGSDPRSMGEGVAPQLWTLCYRSCMAIVELFFDNNVSNKKDTHI